METRDIHAGFHFVIIQTDLLILPLYGNQGHKYRQVAETEQVGDRKANSAFNVAKCHIRRCTLLQQALCLSQLLNTSFTRQIIAWRKNYNKRLILCGILHTQALYSGPLQFTHLSSVRQAGRTRLQISSGTTYHWLKNQQHCIQKWCFLYDSSSPHDQPAGQTTDTATHIIHKNR